MLARVAALTLAFAACSQAPAQPTTFTPKEIDTPQKTAKAPEVGVPAGCDSLFFEPIPTPVSSGIWVDKNAGLGYAGELRFESSGNEHRLSDFFIPNLRSAVKLPSGGWFFSSDDGYFRAESFLGEAKPIVGTGFVREVSLDKRMSIVLSDGVLLLDGPTGFTAVKALSDKLITWAGFETDTLGFAIDVTEKVYKTEDGGATWVEHPISVGPQGALAAPRLSAIDNNRTNYQVGYRARSVRRYPNHAHQTRGETSAVQAALYVAYPMIRKRLVEIAPSVYFDPATSTLIRDGQAEHRPPTGNVRSLVSAPIIATHPDEYFDPTDLSWKATTSLGQHIVGSAEGLKVAYRGKCKTPANRYSRIGYGAEQPWCVVDLETGNKSDVTVPDDQQVVIIRDDALVSFSEKTISYTDVDTGARRDQVMAADHTVRELRWTPRGLVAIGYYVGRKANQPQHVVQFGEDGELVWRPIPKEAYRGAFEVGGLGVAFNSSQYWLSPDGGRTWCDTVDDHAGRLGSRPPICDEGTCVLGNSIVRRGTRKRTLSRATAETFQTAAQFLSPPRPVNGARSGRLFDIELACTEGPDASVNARVANIGRGFFGTASASVSGGKLVLELEWVTELAGSATTMRSSIKRVRGAQNRSSPTARILATSGGSALVKIAANGVEAAFLAKPGKLIPLPVFGKSWLGALGISGDRFLVATDKMFGILDNAGSFTQSAAISKQPTGFAIDGSDVGVAFVSDLHSSIAVTMQSGKTRRISTDASASVGLCSPGATGGLVLHGIADNPTSYYNEPYAQYQVPLFDPRVRIGGQVNELHGVIGVDSAGGACYSKILGRLRDRSNFIVLEPAADGMNGTAWRQRLGVRRDVSCTRTESTVIEPPR